MTPDQQISPFSTDVEKKSSSEVIILDKETVILDNVTGLLFSRIRFTNEVGHRGKFKVLEVITPKDDEVVIDTSEKLIIPSTESVENGLKIVKVHLSVREKTLRVGSFCISPEMVYTPKGHGLLLKINPVPLGHAIVSGFSSENIRHALAVNKTTPNK